MPQIEDLPPSSRHQMRAQRGEQPTPAARSRRVAARCWKSSPPSASAGMTSAPPAPAPRADRAEPAGRRRPSGRSQASLHAEYGRPQPRVAAPRAGPGLARSARPRRAPAGGPRRGSARNPRLPAAAVELTNRLATTRRRGRLRPCARRARSPKSSRDRCPIELIVWIYSDEVFLTIDCYRRLRKVIWRLPRRHLSSRRISTGPARSDATDRSRGGAASGGPPGNSRGCRVPPGGRATVEGNCV